MEHNNNSIKEFFEFINEECISYSISITEEGCVDVKWENMKIDDYLTPPASVINKINLRVQKTKNKIYFLDCFQYSQKTMNWKGFRMSSCTSYEIQTNDNWFDATFHFGENKLNIYKINTEVFLIIQDFFSGFM